MRVWLCLRLIWNKTVVASFGKWATFSVIPRVGETVVYNPSNEMGYSGDVSRIVHWLDDGVVVVWIEDCSSDQEDEDDLGYEDQSAFVRSVRQAIIESGFCETNDLYGAED